LTVRQVAIIEITDRTKVRVKDIPISTDDGQIIKALEEHTCEIINLCMERLRVISV
jgi:hypothetical protein